MTNLLYYMKRRRWRILAVVAILFLMAMFSVRNVQGFMRMSNMLSETDIFTVTDYIIGIFSSAQFVMYFIIPVSFSVLVADLIRGDIDENIIQFVLGRNPNRSAYLKEKCKVIFALAILFTITIFIVAFVVAFLFNISFVGESHHYILLSSNHSAAKTFLLIVPTFILGLLFIGTMTLTISMYTKSAGITIGVIILIGFVHNIFFVIGYNPALAWLPFSPYIAGLYYSFVPFGLNVSYFNSVFAILYMIIGSGIFLGLSMNKLRKMEV